MEYVRCNLCGSNEYEVLHENPGVEVMTSRGSLNMNVVNVACTNCGLVFLNPRMDEQETSAFYEYQFRVAMTGGEDEDEVKGGTVRIEQADRISEHLAGRPPGRVLDVGCFEGYFLHIMARRGWEAHGVEPCKKSVQVARRKYKLDVHGGMYEQSDFEKHSFDLVTMRHVLEHARNPSDMLMLANYHLRTGGTLFLEIPNVYRPFGGKFDDFFSFQHFYNFSPVTLNMVLQKAGFALTGIETDLPYFAFRVLAEKKKDHGWKPLPFIINNDFDTVRRIVDSYRTDRDGALRFLSRKVNSAVDRYVQQGKRVAIFGAGFHTQELLRKTRVADANIIGLFDNDREKQGSELFGYRVYPPDKIDEVGPDAIIISSYAFQEEIYESLDEFRSKGVEVVKIYDRTFSYDSYH